MASTQVRALVNDFADPLADTVVTFPSAVGGAAVLIVNGGTDVMWLRWNAPKVVLRGRHRDGDPVVLALCALGGFLLAMTVSVTGWGWSNVVMGAGSVLAFAAAGRLRRPCANLINNSKETNS